MRRAIRAHAPHAAALCAMFVLAATVSLYILHKQGLRLPLVSAPTLRLEAELPSAQGVAPGQGQGVTVAGVRIGKVAGVRVVGGRARVEINVAPEYRTLVHTNASALLRPRTPLKDMFLEVNPGRAPAPVAKGGFVIPVQNTAADVNQDEILGSLDRDTRDYLQALINGAGVGLQARGADLQDIYFRFKPTHRDIARIGAAMSARDRQLRSLVTALARLDGELARQPHALTRLVNASAAVFDAMGSEAPSLRAAVRDLPGTLRTSRTALASTKTFADALTPTAAKLVPAAKSLGQADAALRPLARVGTPLVRDSIRPFVRQARPLVRDLRPSALRSAKSTPELTRGAVVVNHLLNTFAYNPKPGGGAFDGHGTEGYPFWYAWAAHNTSTVFGTQDADNLYRSVVVGLSCDSAREAVGGNPQLEFMMNLTPLLTSPQTCGGGG